MINSTNVAPQTVAVQGNILFSTDRVRSKRGNSWLYHEVGSGRFLLNNSRCGACACDVDVYEVDFNANLTGTAVGAQALAIFANGDAVGGTEMDYTVATANVYGNVSAKTLVRVPAGTSLSITVRNVGLLAATVKDANIIIKKLA